MATGPRRLDVLGPQPGPAMVVAKTPSGTPCSPPRGTADGWGMSATPPPGQVVGWYLGAAGVGEDGPQRGCDGRSRSAGATRATRGRSPPGRWELVQSLPRGRGRFGGVPRGGLRRKHVGIGAGSRPTQDQGVVAPPSPSGHLDPAGRWRCRSAGRSPHLSPYDQRRWAFGRGGVPAWTPVSSGTRPARSGSPPPLRSGWCGATASLAGGIRR